MRIYRIVLGAGSSLLSFSAAHAQVTLPEITVASPIATISRQQADGILPITADQFATITTLPSSELRRNGASTLGDLLFDKPGITGSSFAPGASSRPIIRGLDVNRVRIQENGIGANGASDLGEDHFVPVDPLTAEKIEVIRGPATLRFGSQAIGGVVDATNNRIPTFIPSRGVSGEMRGGFTSASNGIDGAALLDAGANNFAVHADAFGRTAQDYRVPRYPYLTAPGAADAPNATRPGAFSGRQPNSANRFDGQSVGSSYIFNEGFLGVAVVQNNALYHIPGIDGENSQTRISGRQTKGLLKGEWRAPNSAIDAIRVWGGVTDYKHNELGLADPADLTSGGIRQTFINKEQEGRAEVTLAPFDLRFASLTTAIGAQGGHQYLNAPSPDGAGLWDPNTNWRIAGYMFNELQFSDTTKAQIAGRVERVELSGIGRSFDDVGTMTSTPAAPGYTPKSVSFGIIQNLPMDLVGSITAQYVERAPKPAELFSGGVHDATATFDKGNPNLKIEAAKSLEAGLRRATGPFRFELTAYYTRFQGFIFRRLTGNFCDEAGDCTVAAGLNEAMYSQADAIFRGGEWQSQWDVAPLGIGMFGIENQADMVRATFTDGSNVPRIPPVRIGGGVFWRSDEWFARVKLLHAFAQNNVAQIAETATPGYNDLRAELSYKWRPANPRKDELSEVTVGLVGTNLLNDPIRNSVSYSKNEVLMPGASVRLFANAKY